LLHSQCLGNLLHVIFCDFVDIFPIFKEGNDLYDICY